MTDTPQPPPDQPPSVALSTMPRCAIHLEGPQCIHAAGHKGDHQFAPPPGAARVPCARCGQQDAEICGHCCVEMGDADTAAALEAAQAEVRDLGNRLGIAQEAAAGLDDELAALRAELELTKAVAEAADKLQLNQLADEEVVLEDALEAWRQATRRGV